MKTVSILLYLFLALTTSVLAGQNTDNIILHTKEVRSHLTDKTKLLVTGEFSSKVNSRSFPLLLVKFSDDKKATMLQMIYTPDIYLIDSSVLPSGMKKNQHYKIRVELDDPGSKAVNYEINFISN